MERKMEMVEEQLYEKIRFTTDSARSEPEREVEEKQRLYLMDAAPRSMGMAGPPPPGATTSAALMLGNTPQSPPRAASPIFGSPPPMGSPNMKEFSTPNEKNDSQTPEATPQSQPEVQQSTFRRFLRW